jgi:hypothetical protein
MRGAITRFLMATFLQASDHVFGLPSRRPILCYARLIGVVDIEGAYVARVSLVMPLLVMLSGHGMDPVCLMSMGPTRSAVLFAIQIVVSKCCVTVRSNGISHVM